MTQVPEFRQDGSFERDCKTSRNRHVLSLVTLAVLAVLLVAMALNAFFAAHARKDAEAWKIHTLQVLLKVGQMRAATNEALRGERGYLLTQDERFLAPYARGTAAMPRLTAEIRQLTADNPVQRTNTGALDEESRRYMRALADTVALARAGRIDAAVGTVRAGLDRREIEAMLAILNRIEHEERRLLALRDTADARAATWLDMADHALCLSALAMLVIIGWIGHRAAQARIATLTTEALLRRAATTDDLTGLLNRRAFMEALDTELARSQRSGAPLALALIDLDHFKSVNDRFGHAGGDEALRRFAEVAQETIRACDLVGRLGGEEFAVLMPDTDQIESGIAAERLREAIARRRIILPSGKLVPLTISIGVAHHVAEEDRDRLIVRADEALYEAKHGGRNTTRLAA